MKTRIILLTGLLVIYLSSCTVVGTLYPLSENNDKYLFKKELTGKWRYIGDSSIICTLDTLPKSDGKLYSINVIEMYNNVPDTTSFKGYIINVDGWHFLDCWYNIDEDLDDFLVERHFIVRLSLTEQNKLELSYTNPGKLLKLFDTQKIQLKYARLEKSSEFYTAYYYLILDKPAAMQKALRETMNIPKLYMDSEKIILTRLN